MIRIIFGVAVLIVITVSLVIYGNIKNIGETNKIVVRTYEVIENLNSLNLLLVKFESSQRNFIISGNNDYSESTINTEKVFNKLDYLKKIIYDREQQKNLKLLETLIIDLNKSINNLFNLKKDNKFDLSKYNSEAALEKDLMSDISNLTEKMKQYETILLKEGEKEKLTYSKVSFLLFLSGITLSILLLSTAFYLIRKELNIRKKAENQLEAILDHSTNIIFLKDLEGKYIRVNRKFNEIFNKDNKKVKGKTAYDLYSKEVADSVTRNDSIVISSKSPIQFDETNYVDNVKHNFISIRFPILDVDGNIYAICGMSTEITERQKKEDEIKELNIAMAHNISELQIVNKEIEAFSYSISHDLRSPLRAIGGFSRALMEDFYDKFDDDGQRYLKNIIDNSQRMGQLIDDLLAFSRLGRKQIVKDEIDINEMVSNVIEELKQTDTFHKCKIEVGNLPSISADSAMIKQVFINLLSNAGKFTRHVDNPLIIIDSFSSYLGNIYYVKDNGAGFNMKYIDKLFGVFQRLHSDTEFEGTGVGLALVQRIINKHEGEVWAQAEINEGATFYFSLPKV